MGDLLAKIGEFKDKLGKWLNGEDVELGNIHDEMKKGTCHTIYACMTIVV